MHLVVLRRNNIPIPSSLPTCLQPPFLHKALGLPEKTPPEGDLLQLESDDNQSESAVGGRRDDKNDYQRMVSSTYDELPSKPLSTINKSSTLPKNHYSQHQRLIDGGASGDNDSNVSSSSSKQQTAVTSKNVISSTINRSNSNTPPSQIDANLNDNQNSNKEWTKFAESPTSNLSSPGPKPVNLITNIVDPSQVIHPVALRVTPVGGMEIADDDAQRTFRGADNLVYESGVIRNIANENEKLKKPPVTQSYQRDSLPNDLRAIQRPHPKKPASKNIGTIPLPPIDSNHVSVTTNNSTITTVMTTNKKEVPPLPPPRPHRHTRSSSLDLQRIKLTNNNNNTNKNSNVNGTQEKDPPSSQPPELPPPRLEKTLKMASVDTGYIEAPREESFADFTRFPDENVS